MPHEETSTLSPIGVGGRGVGLSPHSRDQVLFGPLLIDLLVPFLTPRDLSGLARTCKAGAAAVYDEDGRSVVVSLSLKTKGHWMHSDGHGGGGLFGRHPNFGGGRGYYRPLPFITAPMACYMNLGALRFVQITRSDDDVLVDDNTIFQIQQTLGAKLERFSLDLVCHEVPAQEVQHLYILGESLALSPLVNLKCLDIPAEVAGASVRISTGNRCRLESLAIRGSIKNFTNSSLVVQLAAKKSIRRLVLRSMVWGAPALSSAAEEFLKTTLPGVLSFGIDIMSDGGPTTTSLSSLAEHCGNLEKFFIAMADSRPTERHLPSDGFDLVRKLGALPQLKRLHFAHVNIASVDIGTWSAFLCSLQAKDLYFKPGSVKLGGMQCGVFLGLLESGVPRLLGEDCRKGLLERLKSQKSVGDGLMLA